jgi:hypothetical protein
LPESLQFPKRPEIQPIWQHCLKVRHTRSRKREDNDPTRKEEKEKMKIRLRFLILVLFVLKRYFSQGIVFREIRNWA